MTAVFWTWANEVRFFTYIPRLEIEYRFKTDSYDYQVCNSDAEERAITIASMNGVFYACSTCSPLLIRLLMGENHSQSLRRLQTLGYQTLFSSRQMDPRSEKVSQRLGLSGSWPSSLSVCPRFLFLPDVSPLTYFVTVCTVPVELLHRREVLLEAQSKDHGKDEESKSVDGETDSADKVKAGVMVQTLAK